MTIKCKNASQFIFRSLHTVLLSALPERRLHARALRAMKGFLRADDLQKQLCFAASGRAALSLLFRYLHQRSNKPVDTVLLPDYLCNVVSVAAESANLRVCFYDTRDYAPCLMSVLHLLDEYDNACVLFASIMGHRCAHDALFAAVRTQHPHMPMIFDECQNTVGLRDSLPLLVQEDTYCVVSFNNKMTQGLLGGAVYGIPQEEQGFDSQTHAERSRMQLNMTVSYIKQNAKLLREYCTGYYHAPDEEEKSSCEGKYSVAPHRIYKVSLAAAYLGLRNWASNESRLLENAQALLAGSNAVQQVSQCDNPIALYVPIARDSNLKGKYPLKGRYWTSVPCPQYQEHQYIVVHSILKVRDPQ